jgi:hypothetical protein
MKTMITVSDYINVGERLRELNCTVPSSIAILPGNFENAKSKTDFIHEETTPTVRSLWRQSGVTETPIEEPGERFPLRDEKQFEWLVQIIFISASLLSQNPHLVDIALDVISNYLTDWFRGIAQENRRAKLVIVVETRGGKCKRIEYEGPPDGMKDLPDIIEGV